MPEIEIVVDGQIVSAGIDLDKCMGAGGAVHEPSLPVGAALVNMPLRGGGCSGER